MCCISTRAQATAAGGAIVLIFKKFKAKSQAVFISYLILSLAGLLPSTQVQAINYTTMLATKAKLLQYIAAVGASLGVTIGLVANLYPKLPEDQKAQIKTKVDQFTYKVSLLALKALKKPVINIQDLTSPPTQTLRANGTPNTTLFNCAYVSNPWEPSATSDKR